MIRNLKLSLVILLILGGVFDIFSTIYPLKFIVLEGNPLYHIVPSIWGIIAIKLLIISLIAYFFFQAHKQSHFIQYFYMYMVVVLILGQSVAGISNIKHKEKIADDLGYDYANEVPKEAITQYVSTPEDAVKSYMTFITFLIYLPMGLALLSFKLWEWCF